MDTSNLVRQLIFFLIVFFHQREGRWSFAADVIVDTASQTEVKHSDVNPSSTDNKPKEERIICLVNYQTYPLTQFRPIFIEPDVCTHIYYEFAILNSTTFELEFGTPDDETLQWFLEDLKLLKIIKPELKILLSMGGWLDSTRKYSVLMEHPEKTENFLIKVIPLLKKHRFDGLDIAWEYPNCWQGALGVRPNDKKNYVEFLKKAREKFDAEGLLLTVSVSAVKREIEAGYDVPAISKVVDFINVMTYDMHGPWEQITGHHAQFDKKSEDADPSLNTIAAVKLWAHFGAEKSKLNLGIPTYAKTFTLVDPDVHGFGAATKGPGRKTDLSNLGGHMCYNEMCDLLNAGNWTEEEDKTHGFYAYSGDQWACYDPPMMVVRKAKWVAKCGFGGLLFKDASCDDYQGKCTTLRFPLVKMAKMEMISENKRKAKHPESHNDNKCEL